jgi:hypothetical protein
MGKHGPQTYKCIWHIRQMTCEYGGILIYNKNIATNVNHLYMHYNNDIATK